jgi:hypothetical protein
VTQRSFFDIPEAERRRDEGMGRAEQGAPPTWQEAAERAIRFVAEHQPQLTSEDIWFCLDRWGWPLPREPRALGPTMRSADVTSHWIHATDQFVLSERPSRHRAPIRVYASQIFGQVSVNGSTTDVPDPFNPF